MSWPHICGFHDDKLSKRESAGEKMSLNDISIKKAKPGITPRGTATTKPYKIADSGGITSVRLKLE
jgi:hypothetical protein